jgi:hypothetical protein
MEPVLEKVLPPWKKLSAAQFFPLWSMWAEPPHRIRIGGWAEVSPGTMIRVEPLALEL